MKKILSFSLIALFSVSIMAQNKAQITPALKNYSVKTPNHPQKEAVATNYNQPLVLPHSKAYAEEYIGSTQYDLMTNRSSYNRIYLYGDGTIGAIWTFAGQTNYSDRGTGYNYFDGSVWGANPTARIEGIRTGFPSYTPFGAGEVVIAHSATQLYMSQRATKGTGTWTGMAIPFNSGTEPTWPRVCVNGNTIHAICVDYASAALLYFRSTDGGTTWDKQGEEIPGLEIATYYPNGFDADAYDWAEPKNGTIAFLVGDKATDLVLMKSTDNGNTWTKTIVAQHPYPGFAETTTLVLDTPAVCDGAHSIVLDNSGNAFVAFGTCGFLNDNITDGTYNFFPGYHNCIGFWKEGQQTITSLLPEDLDLNCQAIAWSLDLDNTGVLFDANGDFGDYQLGLTTSPQLTIGNDGNLYMIYMSPSEIAPMSGSGQYYNHIWGRSSTTNGDTWTDFVELTAGTDFDFVECAYPSMATNTDGKVHFIYMADFEPGTALNSDADPVGNNDIYYATYDFTDFSSTVIPCTVGLNETNVAGNISVYPNPVADFVNVNYNSIKSADVVVNFYNAVGELVKSESIETERGNSTQISTKGLSSGIYMIKLITPTGTYSQKIIKN